MSVRNLIAVTVASGLVLAITGCVQFSTEYVQGRQDNLDAAVDEFDAKTLGPVVCEGSGGKVAPSQGLTHFMVVADDATWEAISARFEELKYSGTATTSGLAYTRADGILVLGELLGADADNDDLVSSLEDEGCVIPPDGAVWLGFEERPS